jgi:hypothetical protein
MREKEGLVLSIPILQHRTIHKQFIPLHRLSGLLNETISMLVILQIRICIHIRNLDPDPGVKIHSNFEMRSTDINFRISRLFPHEQNTNFIKLFKTVQNKTKIISHGFGNCVILSLKTGIQIQAFYRIRPCYKGLKTNADA